ncbi:MAG: hypothetical protein H7Y43_08275 [Akkermansiaceae bacterium]|nr:hypothetical protein [Verrucomicrobiales bacterium]
MKRCSRIAFAFTVGLMLLAPQESYGQRKMEKLGRGVTAVRSSSGLFVSWRLFGKDPSGIGFNLYRSANGGAFTKVNGSVLTGGTCYNDTAANRAVKNAYYVKPVVNGAEQAASGTFTIAANAAVEPIVRIPIRTPSSGYYTKCVWVGDLDGDGEFDYVIDRLAPFDANNNDIGLGRQYLEAYKRDGTRMWVIDMGPSSTQLYNISPGAATISMGMYDGVTVADMNNDGKAEVILKVAAGTKFANGVVFANGDANKQFLAIVQGTTGNMLANVALPTDFYARAGKYGTQLGVGWQNGKPAVIAWLRNRNTDKSFNDIFVSYYWNGGSIGQNWKHLVPAGTAGIACNHQMRIVDVNGDGNDEVVPGNFCINANGTLRWKLAGVGHGDRFHIGKFDPTRSGLQGFDTQQRPPGTTPLVEIYYDASTGASLWKHLGKEGDDIGRAAAGDIDPGGAQSYEVWSFVGVHNARSNTRLTSSTEGYPWPNLRIWWDGDTLSEDCDGTLINKYNPPTKTTGRLITGYKFGGTAANAVPMIVGDIMGDWREEMVLMNANYSQLMIFSTDVPTTKRIYTLPHNPYYRNCLTVKGYYQSNHTDFFLGNGMANPPVPNITY